MMRGVVFKIGIAILAALFLFMALPHTVLAYDYTLMDGNVRLPIAKPYEHIFTINTVSSGESAGDTLNNATGIFMNSAGHLFVADTGNNRIVKFSVSGQTLGVYSGPPESPLSGPQGVWADEMGNMFIADTGNRRILHLDSQGLFVEEYGRPEGIFEPNFIFDPTKVAVTSSGYIYALKGTRILKIDAYNVFQGEIGQARVGFHFIDFFRRAIYNESQLIQIGRRVPVECTNFILDDYDMVWATTRDSTFGELKRFNAVGESIYHGYAEAGWLRTLRDRYMGALLNPANIFGERMAYGNIVQYPDFRDIAVDKNQIVYALCNAENRIYQYDREGRIISSFGNDWMRPDVRTGQFRGPSGIVVDNDGNIYVLDRILNNIQVYAPTEFTHTVHRALANYYDGDYEAAHLSWEGVLQIDGSYPLAHQGIGLALYKQERYQESMAAFRRAGDFAGYSRAFTRYRHEMFRENFLWVVFGAASIAAAIYFILIKMKRSADKAVDLMYEGGKKGLGPVNMLRASYAALFCPSRLFESVKRHRNRLIYWPSAILLVLMIVARTYQIYGTHYALWMINPRTASLFGQIGQLMAPVISFVIMHFAITSIVGGEAKFGEIFVATAYSTIPYTLFTFLLVLASPLLGHGEQGLMWVFIYAGSGWMYLLYLRNINLLNDYSPKKTIIVAVLVIAGILLAWISLLLGMTLTNQLIEFFAGIFRELRFSLWR